MVVDRCIAAVTDNHGQHVIDYKACRVHGETPGENRFLNINTFLHVGGIATTVTLQHLGSKHPTIGFKGCIKNLMHNKKVSSL